MASTGCAAGSSVAALTRVHACYISSHQHAYCPCIVFTCITHELCEICIPPCRLGCTAEGLSLRRSQQKNFLPKRCTAIYCAVRRQGLLNSCGTMSPAWLVHCRRARVMKQRVDLLRGCRWQSTCPISCIGWDDQCLLWVCMFPPARLPGGSQVLNSAQVHVKTGVCGRWLMRSSTREFVL